MSNLENPRFTERTSTNLERCHRLPHVCTIMICGNLGGHRLQEKSMIDLIPERRLCFLFDQASSLQDSELSEELLLENVLCIFFHLPAWTASLLASHLYTATLQLSGRTSPNAMALARAQTFAKKNVK